VHLQLEKQRQQLTGELQNPARPKKKNENKLKRKTSAESCSLNKGFSTQLESVQRVSLGQMNINWPGSVVLTEMNGCQLSRSAENTN